MKVTNYLNLDHHDSVAIDLIDGRRIELLKGDKLYTTVESVTVKQPDGFDIIYPAIQVAQVIKKVKARYL